MEPERGTRKGQMEGRKEEGRKEGSTMRCPTMVKAVQKFHDKINAPRQTDRPIVRTDRERLAGRSARGQKGGR